jgi:glucokinase
MALLLAADMGGTKSNLCLIGDNNTRREEREHATLRSADYPDACAVLQAFLGNRRVDAAVIAIAGPVLDGRAETPNLPWVVERVRLARMLGTGRVELINDLVATAYGIGDVGPDSLVVLNAGVPTSTGTIAVIAAGTGLGEAALVADGNRRIALPSEGGHADFGPGNEDEIALLRHLARRHGRVSWERVVSGAGLHAIYEFLVESGRAPPSGALAARIASGDPPAAIADAALAQTDPASVLALDMFVRAYGAEAGNLALKVMATGGVFVAGGIAPKILPRLHAGPFMAGFLDKGRLSGLLERIPVKVVLEPDAALIGAARRVEELALA